MIKVGLFIPCYIDQFYPQVGIATQELLQKIGLNIVFPLQQTCFRQPIANNGAEHEAIPVCENFVRNFSEFDYIVSPSGSCVYYVCEHYDIQEQTDEVRKVRQNTYELCEFIADNGRSKELGSEKYRNSQWYRKNSLERRSGNEQR